MIKVAFCDDDQLVRKDLCAFLDRYRVKSDHQIECAAFSSPLELMAEIEKGARYDILFLDILMPGETGINVAAEIRGYDSNVKIIFLTSSQEYAVQSYTVGAHYYQLKPVREENFIWLMDSAIMQCEKEREDSLILRCKNGITRIGLRKLEYCEVNHRTLFIHLGGGEILESVGSLDELTRQLELYGYFLRPHRSYLINLDYVQKLTYHNITMASSAQIPLARGKYQEVKDAYLKRALANHSVML